MRTLLDYLPYHLQLIEEYQEICRILQEDIDELYTQRYNVLYNQFISTANDTGLRRYESMFGLRGNSSMSYEERRFALHAMLIDKRPVTYNFLLEQLTLLCGEDGFQVVTNFPNYIIDIQLSLAQKSTFDAVSNLIAKIMPANLQANVQIIYNRYQDVSVYTYAELSLKTCTEIKEELI